MLVLSLPQSHTKTFSITGVVKEFRKNGIASFLLDNLVAHITNPYNDPPTDDVRALYLHVLTTNSQAIAFYEHRGFRAHLFLPYYYAIKGSTNVLIPSTYIDIKLAT